MPKLSAKAGSSQPKAPSVPSTLTDSNRLPQLIVFDLDYTLWPFWVDTHVSTPIKPITTTSPSCDFYTSAVKDRSGETFTFYPSCPTILALLEANPNIKVAAASRTQAPELAREMLRTLQIPPLPSSIQSGPIDSPSSTAAKAKSKAKKSDQTESARKAIEFFDHLEIYPGSKLRHFEKLQKATGLPFEEMLFFDDEKRNREVEKLGVTMWWVPDGVNVKTFDEGVREWRKRRGVTMNGSGDDEDRSD